LKSRHATLRVLLDTSFILPSLGIDVGGEVAPALAGLAETQAEIHYSRFSMLESLWVAARTIQDAKFDAETFKLGVRSIMEGGRYRKVDEDSEIINEALRLYELGHKDMIDNTLYASAARLDLRLLTVDSNLKAFVKEKGLKDTLMSPDQVASTSRLH